ncbi:MAG: hypothetical protein K9K88_04915 [Desulfobacterales bacterium]|nr:hypothetical protein [Desulfobacterales bacterium]
MEAFPGKRRSKDRFDAARVLFRAAFLLSVLAAGAVCADALLRAGAPVEAPKAAVSALHLSSLALVPSGRPLRLPGGARTGVDLRHDFFLPRPAPDLSGLLLPTHGQDPILEQHR